VSNKQEETDIIEGEADIIEPETDTPAVKKRPQPYGARFAIIVSIISVLVSFMIGAVLYREWTNLTDRVQDVEMLKKQLETHSHDYENQISSLLSQNQTYQGQIEELKRQLREVSVSFQENVSPEAGKPDSALIVSVMMWQLADDSKLGSLSHLITPLPDSELKEELRDIISTAQQLEIDALLSQGNQLLQILSSSEPITASEETAAADGLFDRLATWFSSAVKLEAIETDISQVQHNEIQQKHEFVLSLPVLVKHLENLDDEKAKAWVQRANIRLALRQNLEELIIMNLNKKRELP